MPAKGPLSGFAAGERRFIIITALGAFLGVFGGLLRYLLGIRRPSERMQRIMVVHTSSGLSAKSNRLPQHVVSTEPGSAPLTLTP